MWLGGKLFLALGSFPSSPTAENKIKAIKSPCKDWGTPGSSQPPNAKANSQSERSFPQQTGQ